jgi:hypothetical protein
MKKPRSERGAAFEQMELVLYDADAPTWIEGEPVQSAKAATARTSRWYAICWFPGRSA